MYQGSKVMQKYSQYQLQKSPKLKTQKEDIMFSLSRISIIETKVN